MTQLTAYDILTSLKTALSELRDAPDIEDAQTIEKLHAIDDQLWELVDQMTGGK